jgi:hypothetical protein
MLPTESGCTAGLGEGSVDVTLVLSQDLPTDPKLDVDHV